jgi:hypothetical protein
MAAMRIPVIRRVISNDRKSAQSDLRRAPIEL